MSPARAKAQPAIVLIDPDASGSALAHSAHEAGYKVIVWITVPSEQLEPKKPHFDWILIEPSLDLTLERLRNSVYRIHAVIPGSQAGAISSDALANKLGLPSNTPPKTNEAIRRAGLRVFEEAFTEGSEYLLNLFGDGLQPHVTELWHCEKTQNEFAEVLDFKIILQPLYSPQFKELREYAVLAAKSAGLSRGPIHAKILIDHKGPAIVYVTNGYGPQVISSFARTFSNFDPFSATIEVFANGWIRFPEQIRFTQHLGMVYCQSKSSGKLEKLEGIEEIKKLSSYHRHLEHVQQGQEIQPTRGPKTIPLTVWLAGQTQERIEEDADEVHELFHARVSKSSSPLAATARPSIRAKLSSLRRHLSFRTKTKSSVKDVDRRA